MVGRFGFLAVAVVGGLAGCVPPPRPAIVATPLPSTLDGRLNYDGQQIDQAWFYGQLTPLEYESLEGTHAAIVAELGITEGAYAGRVPYDQYQQMTQRADALGAMIDSTRRNGNTPYTY